VLRSQPGRRRQSRPTGVTETRQREFPRKPGEVSEPPAASKGRAGSHSDRRTQLRTKELGLGWHHFLCRRSRHIALLKSARRAAGDMLAGKEPRPEDVRVLDSLITEALKVRKATDDEAALAANDSTMSGPEVSPLRKPSRGRSTAEADPDTAWWKPATPVQRSLGGTFFR
jgi:hypothetical protein